MDFPSASAKAAFVTRLKLAFEYTSFERKTMKYFILGFYQSLLPPVKRARSFDIVKGGQVLKLRSHFILTC